MGPCLGVRAATPAAPAARAIRGFHTPSVPHDLNLRARTAPPCTVYKPVGARRVALRLAAVFMLLVAAGATIASLRNIIVKWQTFQFV